MPSYDSSYHNMSFRNTNSDHSHDTAINNDNDNDDNNNNNSLIGPITNKIINGVINEFNKNNNRIRIRNHIIDPITQDINQRYYPHFILLVSLLLIIIFLLTCILVGKK